MMLGQSLTRVEPEKLSRIVAGAPVGGTVVYHDGGVMILTEEFCDGPEGSGPESVTRMAITVSGLVRYLGKNDLVGIIPAYLTVAP